MTERIVFVGGDRQLHVVEPDGSGQRQLTLDLASNPLLVWGKPDLDPTAWSWPVWSPDGQWIACFELPAGDDVSGPARLHALEVDGVRQIELATLSGRVPIYGSWSPDGASVTVMLQDEEQLVLGVVRVDRPGALRVIEEGVPLFFAWTPDRRHLLVHAGTGADTDRSRLVVRDALGSLPDAVLPQDPGNFCTPVFVGERLVHVDRTSQVNRLLSTDAQGGDVRVLLEFSGLGAVVPVPGRDAVVFSAAPAGQGSPYRGATLVDIRTGELTRLCEDNCLAFFWSSGRSQLIYARVDTEHNCLAWRTVRPGGSPEEVARFWPSREMLFHLHFFDQFIQSHALVSPSGRYLVYCGNTVDDIAAAASPKVLVLDLDTPDAPRVVGQGAFACFPMP